MFCCPTNGYFRELGPPQCPRGGPPGGGGRPPWSHFGAQKLTMVKNVTDRLLASSRPAPADFLGRPPWSHFVAQNVTNRLFAGSWPAPAEEPASSPVRAATDEKVKALTSALSGNAATPAPAGQGARAKAGRRHQLKRMPWDVAQQKWEEAAATAAAAAARACRSHWTDGQQWYPLRENLGKWAKQQPKGSNKSWGKNKRSGYRASTPRPNLAAP